MRKTLRASVLVLMVCCPAFAGDIPNPVYVPTPQPARNFQEETTDGDITDPVTGAPTADAEMLDDATAIYVNILLNLLALS